MDNDQHWNNDANWKLNSIYVCGDDPRLIVSKKRPWAGWTFNFAHRGAFMLLFYVLLVAFAPSLYVIATGNEDKIWYAVGLSTVLVSVAMFFCARIGRT